MVPPYGVSLQHMVQLLVNKISYEKVSYEMSYGFRHVILKSHGSSPWYGIVTYPIHTLRNSIIKWI